MIVAVCCSLFVARCVLFVVCSFGCLFVRLFDCLCVCLRPTVSC